MTNFDLQDLANLLQDMDSKTPSALEASLRRIFWKYQDRNRKCTVESVVADIEGYFAESRIIGSQKPEVDVLERSCGTIEVTVHPMFRGERPIFVRFPDLTVGELVRFRSDDHQELEKDDELLIEGVAAQTVVVKRVDDGFITRVHESEVERTTETDFLSQLEGL